jgi:hypothetical protein
VRHLPPQVAYVSICQHPSASVSIRQHPSAYVSIRQHPSLFYMAVCGLACAICAHKRSARRIYSIGIAKWSYIVYIYIQYILIAKWSRLRHLRRQAQRASHASRTASCPRAPRLRQMQTALIRMRCAGGVLECGAQVEY